MGSCAGLVQRAAPSTTSAPCSAGRASGAPCSRCPPASRGARLPSSRGAASGWCARATFAPRGARPRLARDVGLASGAVPRDGRDRDHAARGGAVASRLGARGAPPGSAPAPVTEERGSSRRTRAPNSAPMSTGNNRRPSLRAHGSPTLRAPRASLTAHVAWRCRPRQRAATRCAPACAPRRGPQFRPETTNAARRDRSRRRRSEPFRSCDRFETRHRDVGRAGAQARWSGGDADQVPRGAPPSLSYAPGPSPRMPAPPRARLHFPTSPRTSPLTASCPSVSKGVRGGPSVSKPFGADRRSWTAPRPMRKVGVRDAVAAGALLKGGST
jgi:hypothetical protein